MSDFCETFKRKIELGKCVKKTDRVLREILYRVYERNESFMSQKSLAQACETSMDTVNRVVNKLNRFRSIEKKPFGFRVTNAKKILTYWAGARNLARDVTYSTYSPDSVEEMEREFSRGVFTAYSGYKLKFEEIPVHYEGVYVYADAEEARRRFPESKALKRNLFVLSPDPHLERVSEKGSVPLAQLYVDLWQIGGATADRFLLEIDHQIELKSAEALKALARREF